MPDSAIPVKIRNKSASIDSAAPNSLNPALLCSFPSNLGMAKNSIIAAEMPVIK